MNEECKVVGLSGKAVFQKVFEVRDSDGNVHGKYVSEKHAQEWCDLLNSGHSYDKP